MPHAEALLAFAEAAVGGDAGELAQARERMVSEMGDRALVDTAAIVGNFQRMTRIADGTGIPLDGPANTFSAGIQQQLELTSFASAANSTRVGAFSARLAAAARPLVFRALSAVMSRTRGDDS